MTQPTTLTPKLRFPEFRNGPSWDGKPMGEIYSFKGNNSLSRDQLNYEAGSVKNIHYGDIHTKFSTLFDVTKETVPFINPSESLEGLRPDDDCVEGDMIFADASEDLADIGKSIEVVRLNGERVVAGQHTILARPNDNQLAVGFGAYLFKSRHVRTQIQKESQGSKVLGISAKRLTKIDLPIPRTKAEQQKIAECLSTLDELIGAESQKLDALKAHKKGLMQQLFPREGETLPRLRFPEFRNAPEWEETSLGEVARLRNGYAFRSAEYVESGEFQIITIANVQQGRLELSSTKRIEALPPDIQSHQILHPGDILISMTGNVGRVCVVDREGLLLNQRVGNLVPQGIDRCFFYQLLQRDDFRSTMQLKAAGGAQGNLSSGDISEYSFRQPCEPAEQHRIATCLSSLDDLIAAQSERISALQTHKQGLLQHLFPVAGENA